MLRFGAAFDRSFVHSFDRSIEIERLANNVFRVVWPFLFCFVPKTVYGPKFFELFAKPLRIFRPRGIFFNGPKIFQNLADSAAIRLVQKSSKSEPSSPFFGRLKFRESLSRTSSFKIFYADTK